MTQLLDVDNLQVDVQRDIREDIREDEIPAPNIDHLVLEDDAPVDNFQADNFQSAQQQRLLVEPLYSSSVLASPFIADANVGIFAAEDQEGIVPDVFLSLGVQRPEDYSQKRNRSYLVWRFGKFPDLAIEIVSNRKGNELMTKDPAKPSKEDSYARMGIGYYVVSDPLQQIQESEQMNRQPLKVFVLTGRHYQELPEPFWLEDVGLGLTLWQGELEGTAGQWLRWCDRAGQVIPTGAERADQLAERLRSLGVDPDAP